MHLRTNSQHDQQSNRNLMHIIQISTNWSSPSNSEAFENEALNVSQRHSEKTSPHRFRSHNFDIHLLALFSCIIESSISEDEAPLHATSFSSGISARFSQTARFKLGQMGRPRAARVGPIFAHRSLRLSPSAAPQHISSSAELTTASMRRQMAVNQLHTFTFSICGIFIAFSIGGELGFAYERVCVETIRFRVRISLGEIYSLLSVAT